MVQRVTSAELRYATIAREAYREAFCLVPRAGSSCNAAEVRISRGRSRRGSALEVRHRRGRDRRASVSRAGGRRGAARARARGGHLHFGEGCRCARDEGPDGVPVREAAEHRDAEAFFAGDPRFSQAVQRQPRAVPQALPEVQAARGSRHGRVYLDRADPRRADAEDPDLRARVERDPRQGEPAQRADDRRGAARVRGLRAVFSEFALPGHRHADSQEPDAARPARGGAGGVRAAARSARRCWSWAAARGRTASTRR